MISPPDFNRKQEALRAVVEALAQATPLTAGLARLYQTTHPPRSQVEFERWSGEVTAALNSLMEQTQVVGGFRISQNTVWGRGISSITDNGVGHYSIHFAQPLGTQNYHVSVTTDQGNPRIVERTPNGFVIMIKGPCAPCDADFSFSVDL